MLNAESRLYRHPAVEEEVGAALCSGKAVRQRPCSSLPANSPAPTAHERCTAERWACRLQRNDRLVVLRTSGMAKQRIARGRGLGRRTVATWIAVGHSLGRATRPPQVVDA